MGENWIVQNCRKLIPVSDQYDGDNFFTLLNALTLTLTLTLTHDVQAACEPGGGGCGGVPDHPARLHTHRTSPAQALLTMLTGHAATCDLLSHCHRRVSGVRCALAER
jgi:hypothetical protein